MTTLTRVQQQYEVLPYPHRDPERELEQLLQTILCELPRIQSIAWGGPRDLSTLRVLDAGCGTGDNTVFLAHQLQGTGAEIVALDFSNTSLDINRARLAKRGLDNVRHVLAPIEEAPSLDLGEFDFIVCSGVLHHLSSPLEGLTALRSMLKPDGLMGVMVYARYGREPVYLMQALLRRLAPPEMEPDKRLRILKRTFEGLPKQSRTLRGLLDSPYLLSEITRSDAGAYDLLLHTQDRPYTVPELHEWMGDAGMRVVEWSVPRSYDPTTYLKDIGLSHLDGAERAATAELMHGGMMKHEFWCERDDAPVRPSVAADDVTATPVWVSLDFPGQVQATLALKELGPEMRCSFGPERDVVVSTDALGRHFLGSINGVSTVGDILEGAYRIAGTVSENRIRARWVEFAEAFRSVGALALYEGPRA
ncbi:MAG: class I SAM-dependent methyltransferase [Dehalococcoidia bacterium]|nr:class I SAM-dependent methyltransferase [Dehalococcoidia bacterium]